MEEGKRGQGAVASSGSFLGGAGEAGGRWGSGNQADTWRKQGTSKGGGSLPTGGWRPTVARGRRALVTCAVHELPVE
jgi:hypothetical protein